MPQSSDPEDFDPPRAWRSTVGEGFAWATPRAMAARTAKDDKICIVVYVCVRLMRIFVSKILLVRIPKGDGSRSDCEGLKKGF